MVEIEKKRELTKKELILRWNEIMASCDTEDEKIIALILIELFLEGVITCSVSEPFDGNFYWSLKRRWFI